MSGYGLVQIFPPNGVPYDFGIVTSITDSLSKSVTVTEIVSLSTSCTFALEGGTSNSYSIQFTRRNPHKPDGTSYESDSDYSALSWKWTNAMWEEAVSSLLNRWQAHSDGYTILINGRLDGNGKLIWDSEADGTYINSPARYTDLYPVVLKNIYVKTMSFKYSAGDTDTISGSLQVYVGGRNSCKLTLGGSKSIVYTNRKLAVNRALRSILYRSIPLFNSESSYNQYNEYTEKTTKAEKLVTVAYMDGDYVKDVLLLKGGNGKPGVNDWQVNSYDELSDITSCTVEGGPSKPFESITIKVNMNRLAAENPDIFDTDAQNNDESEGYRLIPGTSTLYANVFGYGTYVLTEYKSSDSTMTLKGYCNAAVLTAAPWPTDVVFDNADPYDLILNILTTTDYGMTTPFTESSIITTWTESTGRKYTATIKDGVSVWQVLWYLAGMCNCRMFCTATQAYIVDYTLIAEQADGLEGASGSSKDGGNRLWIRDGLDEGYIPNDDGTWNRGNEKITDPATNYLLDSFELHSSSELSRVGTRITDSVSCPTTSDRTQLNTITVKYNDGSAHIYYIGHVKEYDTFEETLDGESYKGSDLADSDGNPTKRGEVLARAKASYLSLGTLSDIIDLTGTFTTCTFEMARDYAFFMLAYRVEPIKEVSFTLAENYSPEAGSDTEVEREGDDDVPFWSAIFPNVCAVKRFTDLNQSLTVSSHGTYDDKYRSEKTFLTTYSRKYPEQQTTYTFGEITPITLANNTSKTEVMLKSK